MTTTTLHPTTLKYIQSRANTDHTLVDEYAAMMRDGVEFDPVSALKDKQGSIYVYDGQHRGLAAQKAQIMLRVTYRDGTKAQAEWLALAANTKHGLRRSRADKQRVTKSALLINPKLSDREIARHCSVDHKTVGKLRAELVASGEIPQITERTVERNGTTYTQAARAEPDPKPKPEPKPYIPIHALEQLIKAWLDGLHDQSLVPDILSKIKERTPEGQAWLSEISGYVETHHDAPHRKGDLRQACNNTLDQLQQKRERDAYYDRITLLTCTNCGQQTIKDAVAGDGIICSTCKRRWQSLAAYDEQAADDQALETQRAQQPPAVCANCGQECDGPLTEAGLCCFCNIETRARERKANSLPPKPTADRRFELKQRIQELLRSIPDEDLDKFDDWLSSVEESFKHLSIKEM